MSLHIFRIPTTCVLLLALASWGTEAFAWTRGNHAGSWTPGASIKVFLDPIPADAPAGTAAAMAEAIKEWNDAQAPFGGLQLVTEGADKTNSEIHISWGKNLPAWGSVAPKKGADPGFANSTVKVSVEIGDGLDARGITRVLKHELGHAEGLGHSAKSDLMKADAYSTNPGTAPTTADLNSADPFTEPTADDKAGKKALWGTAAKLSMSEVTSSSFWDGVFFNYSYSLEALLLPGLTDPVTEFTLDLPVNLRESDFNVTVLPSGWDFEFFSGLVDPFGKGFEDEEEFSPSLLSFFALGAGFGVNPGDTVDFGIASLIPPANTRAFTNSPSFDSDEFEVLAPASVPEPSTLLLCFLGALGLWATQKTLGFRQFPERFAQTVSLAPR